MSRAFGGWKLACQLVWRVTTCTRRRLGSATTHQSQVAKLKRKYFASGTSIAVANVLDLHSCRALIRLLVERLQRRAAGSMLKPPRIESRFHRAYSTYLLCTDGAPRPASTFCLRTAAATDRVSGRCTISFLLLRTRTFVWVIL